MTRYLQNTEDFEYGDTRPPTDIVDTTNKFLKVRGRVRISYSKRTPVTCLEIKSVTGLKMCVSSNS